MPICGIYKFQNKINNQIYIGQSIDIKKRYREHINAAVNPNNRDYNLPIHAALRKHGIESFEFTVIEEIPRDQLDEREQFWIAYYNSFNKGYNATPGGQEGGYNGKPVNLYYKNGAYYMTLPSVKEAAKFLNVSYSVIQQVLHGERKSCRGYQAKFDTGNHDAIAPYSSRQGGSHIVLQLDLRNNILKEWPSARQAGLTLNIDPSSIIKVCRGKAVSCGGYGWAYKKSQKGGSFL